MKITFKRQKLRLWLPLFIVLTFASGLLVNLYSQKESVKNRAQAEINDGEKDDQKIVEYRIKSGDTLSTVFESVGIPEDVNKLILASKEVYDFTKIKTGQLLKFIFVQEAFASMEYIATDHEVISVEKTDDGFNVVENDIEYDINEVVVDATISSSLFIDGKGAGLEDKTIMELANLFGWDVDFTADIREGDSFKVIYEKRLLDGEPARPGKILAAWFENQGQKYWAILYKDPTGKEKYYTLEGRTVARQFLKSALDYKYISSVFTKSRINPVTKKLKPHLAVDFAAPKGTPVFSLGDGTVSYAGWKGGYGNNIEIKHNGQYLTQYAHLSKIAKGIKPGVSVEQGQIIGYVGSTGISTGPHLHFAVNKGGTALNPIKFDVPPGNLIEDAWLNDFNTKKEILVKSL